MIGSIAIKGSPSLTTAPQFGFSLLAARGDFSGYWHEKRANGGDWACSFEIHAEENDLIDLFEKGLMAHVESFSQDGIRAWHGFIASMTLETPFGTIKTRAVDLYNLVKAQYTTTQGDANETMQVVDSESQARNSPVYSAGTPTYGSTYTNGNSISRFGRREYYPSVGEVPNVSVANQVAQTVLADKAWPNTKPTTLTIGKKVKSKIRLIVHCWGYFQAYAFQVYTNGAGMGVTHTLTQKVQDIGTSSWHFYINSYQTENNSTVVWKRAQNKRQIIDVLMDIARLGDSSFNRWVVYSIDRTLYYEQAASSEPQNLRYSVKQLDDEIQVMDKTQSPVPYELIQPNEYIRVEPLNSVRTVRDDLGEDESVAYIESVIYRDPDEIEISGDRQSMLDVQLNRLSLGNNSDF